MKAVHFFLSVSCICVAFAAGSASAQQIDPRRVASCYLAAENLRDRGRPDASDYAQLDEQTSYWRDKVAVFVPNDAERASLVAGGRVQLDQALSQQGYMAGMMMVGSVLSQCNARRDVIERAAPHG